MANEITLSSAATLIEVSEDTINGIRDIWGNETDFEELNRTISTLRTLLLDAEFKWDQLPNLRKDIIRKLKDVVYDADDLFDEFHTLVAANQLSQLRKGGKFSKKMSRELKDIHERLAAIDFEYRDLGLDVNNEFISIRMTRDETCSYVNANDIIGRDEDKEAIIDMLLHNPSNCDTDSGVCFLSIVGVGGLGKTALAQLVFNDERIIQEFPERLWVSVSDLYREQFDLKTILCKILKSVTDHKYNVDTSTLELVKTQFVEKLKGRKYILVLDDVWNEIQDKWLDLKRFLMLGQEGSKVLVTTRSIRTATLIGDRDEYSYMLQQLSKEDSWRLFEMSAFNKGSEEEFHHELVELGKNIVDKCYRNPLGIKVVGNHLLGQPINKWQSFERCGLAKIGQGNDGILHSLKLSCQNLDPLTQRCFRYCANFPKDIRIWKEKMIGLWAAQGYVILSDRNQSLDDVAEEHFSNMLDKCFFEDVVKDEYGDVESFKIYGLMHDVAQEVGQEEICITTPNMDCLGNNIRHVRHVHHVGDDCLDISVYSKKIRSYVSCSGHFITDKQINNWMRLRVLDLSGADVKNLRNSVGKLLHLRYLDLSHNRNLELLCEPITQLYTLQTLDLNKCNNLTSVPSGMDKLTNLRVLPLFVVGNSISSERQSHEGVIEDLEALN